MKPMTRLAYADRIKEFDLFSYFQGETQAWGVFEDCFGGIRRKFVVNIVGERVAGELVLTEYFEYDDGCTERRVWRIRQVRQHEFRGRTDDIVGHATGVSDANTLNWCYRMRLRIGGKSIVVRFDDRMYFMPDQTLVNRARVSKYGITLGTLSLFFKPRHLSA